MRYIDDSLDVFVCHGLAGTLGAFLLGWFASRDANPAGQNGILYGGGELLGWQVRSLCPSNCMSFFFTDFSMQIIAILMTIALSVTGTAGILVFLRYAITSSRLAVPHFMVNACAVSRSASGTTEMKKTREWTW